MLPLLFSCHSPCLPWFFGTGFLPLEMMFVSDFTCFSFGDQLCMMNQHQMRI